MNNAAQDSSPIHPAHYTIDRRKALSNRTQPGRRTVAKRNDEEVKREVNRLLQEVAVYEQQAQQLGLAFASMSEEELASTIQQSGPVRPFVYGSTVRAYPGATYTLIMGLINTGSVDLRCYVALFFGAAATYMPDIEWALLSGREPPVADPNAPGVSWTRCWRRCRLCDHALHYSGQCTLGAPIFRECSGLELAGRVRAGCRKRSVPNSDCSAHNRSATMRRVAATSGSAVCVICSAL